MDFALNSIIGKRENQEDYGVIKSSGSTGGLLAIISDGMGGQVAGEIASLTSVKKFEDSFTSNNSKNLPLKLNLALDKANLALRASISVNPNLRGMGATLIAAYIDPKSINWISVGDSILYLYREKKLHRLNEDHSMTPVLQDSVRLGKITQDEARAHPHRNALRSALMGEEIPIIDLREEPLRLKKDDCILLATDGLLTLTGPEISSILEHCKDQSARAIVDQLLSAVSQKNKPRQDNTLIEVIKVSGSRLIPMRLAIILAGISISISILAILAVTHNKKLREGLASRLPNYEVEKNQETSASEVKPIVLTEPPSPTEKPTHLTPRIETVRTGPEPETISSTKNSRSGQDKNSAPVSKNEKAVEKNAGRSNSDMTNNKAGNSTPANSTIKTEPLTPANSSIKTEPLTPANSTIKTEPATPANSSIKNEPVTPVTPANSTIKTEPASNAEKDSVKDFLDAYQTLKNQQKP